MATVEVFTVGGGEYIVNVFNAVAAWTGQGGYKSLIQVVMVMGLAYASVVVAFNSDWRSWINWFLQATLIYACLMVPRVDVQVVDRLNPGLAPSNVANVPLGLGMMASFTSQIGDYLTTSAEVVFGLPNDMQYSTNGMVYGARLIDAAQGLRINDPEFATNLDEHIRNCVYYDVLLGHKSMTALANSSDLWTSMGPGSPARAQKYITDDQAATTQTTSIVTCQVAYQQLSAAWAQAEGRAGVWLGKNLYQGLDSVVLARLYADLGGAYTYLTGVAQDGSATLKQTLLLNAFNQSIHTMNGTPGNATDVYAQTRAEIQTKNTYGSIGAAAEKWVPLLQIVLTVIFYALFPVLFPLFLLPSGGVGVLKGYITGFFYLAAWGPLFAILHMMLMFKGVHDLSSAAGMPDNGVTPTLFNYNSIGDAASDIAMLAGYMMASIPFLAGGIARGAMAISSNATSFLQPSQSAAEAAANDVTTGNLATGNSSFDNQTTNTRQANKWSNVSDYTSGASAFRTVNNDGSVTSSYPGNEVIDTSGAISRLENSPSLTQDFQSSLTKSASESRSRAESLFNSASSSFSAANNAAGEFRTATSAGTTLDRTIGADDRSTISSTFSQIDNAATALQNRFGFERSKAESLAKEKFFSGQINTSTPGGGGAGGTGGGKFAIPVGGSVNTGFRNGVTESGSVSGSDSLSEAKDFLDQYGRSHSWGTQKDAFDKIAQSSSNTALASKARTVSETYNKANGVAQEARTAYDQSRRYEEAASLRDSEGVSVAGNLSQRYVRYVAGEQARLAAGGVRSTYNPTRGLALSPDDRNEEAYYIKRFVAAERDRIGAGVEPQLVAPTPAGLIRPAASTQSKIHALATGGEAAIDGRPMPVSPNVPSAATVYAVNRARVGAEATGAERVEERVDAREKAFAKVTPTLSPQPQTTLDNVKRDNSITAKDGNVITRTVSNLLDP